MAENGCCSLFTSLLFEYDTQKIVHIKNKKIGIIFRLIQLLIIGYIIGYVIVYKKGYQEFQSPYSSVTTKLKGVALTNLSDLEFYGQTFVWDTADLVIPPEENGALFVMTNMIITPRQTQGKCPEDPKIKKASCTKDSDCPYMGVIPGGHGLNTGKCVASDRQPKKKVCEVFSWCPIEVDVLPMPGHHLRPNVPLLEAVRNFTLLIKNTVQFPKFDETRRNIDKSMEELGTCNFDPVKDPLCPIFKLDTIEKLAKVDFDKMAYEGGVMSVEISWNCNFDPLAKHCEPKYAFRRLDSTDGHTIAPGYSFRYPKYYIQNNTLYRTLTKAYGIRFVVSVYGQGGKFSVVPLFLNIGSGLALLGISTVLCDIIVLYVVQKRNLYREKKYLNVEDSQEDEEKFNLEKSNTSYTKEKNEEESENSKYRPLK